MQQILVVGSANLDVVCMTEHLPLPGETITATNFFTGLGGKGANQASAAAKLGGIVRLASAVGSDDAGSLIIKSLQENGVITDEVEHLDGPSGCAYITIDSKGENVIVVSPGANHKFELGDIDASEIVLMQGELTPTIISQMAMRANAWGSTLVLNPSPFIELDENLLKRFDYLFLNEGEAEKLATQLGIQENHRYQDLAELIGRRLEIQVILTLGAAGSILWDRNKIWLQKATPANEVLDTTGAGDAFLGAFVFALSQGNSAVRSIAFATAAASLAVEKLGASSSYPKQAELFDRLLITSEATNA